MTPTIRRISATRLLESASIGGTDHHFITGLDTLRMFPSKLVIDRSAECLEVADREVNSYIESII